MDFKRNTNYLTKSMLSSFSEEHHVLLWRQSKTNIILTKIQQVIFEKNTCFRGKQAYHQSIFYVILWINFVTVPSLRRKIVIIWSDANCRQLSKLPYSLRTPESTNSWKLCDDLADENVHIGPYSSQPHRQIRSHRQGPNQSTEKR